MAGTATGGILGCGGPSTETGTLSDLTAYDTAGRLLRRLDLGFRELAPTCGEIVPSTGMDEPNQENR